MSTLRMTGAVGVLLLQGGGDVNFLTLSILSDHEAGDALSPQPLASVPRGRLFAVDPMTRHWLAGAGAWRSNRTKPWVGVQWAVPCAEAKATARRIVQELGGNWVKSTDRRYKGWAPSVPGAVAASTAGASHE